MMEKANTDPLDLAWLVGLLEGEGSFNLASAKSNGRKYFYARIALRMTDLDILRRAANIMQPPSIRFDGVVQPNRKPCFYFQVNGRHAVEWMGILYPFMGLRRRAQIAACLAHNNELTQEQQHPLPQGGQSFYDENA